jgi:hypothetical protein
MGTHLPAGAGFRLRDRDVELSRQEGRSRLAAAALEEIQAYVQARGLAVARQTADLSRRLGFKSHDPDQTYRRQHCEQLLVLLHALLLALCDQAGRDVAEMPSVGPAGGFGAERNFEHALAKKVAMYKRAADHLVGSSLPHLSLSDDLCREIRGYHA